MTDGHYKV